jgi:hypothetical protein
VFMYAVSWRDQCSCMQSRGGTSVHVCSLVDGPVFMYAVSWMDQCSCMPSRGGTYDNHVDSGNGRTLICERVER